MQAHRGGAAPAPRPVAAALQAAPRRGAAPELPPPGLRARARGAGAPRGGRHAGDEALGYPVLSRRRAPRARVPGRRLAGSPGGRREGRRRDPPRGRALGRARARRPGAPAAAARDRGGGPRRGTRSARFPRHALPLPGGGRGLPRLAREGAPRRRHGARQDGAGDRGDGAPDAQGRRAAHAHRLPGVAEAPVGARDRALRRARRRSRPGDPRPARGAAPSLRRSPRGHHHQLRAGAHRRARSRGARARPPRPRRGPAHQELAHAYCRRGEARPQPLRVRAHGHAAGEPPRRSLQPDAGRRPARLRPPVALQRRVHRYRRARQGGGLQEPGPPAPPRRRRAAPAAQGRGAPRATGAARQPPDRAHDAGAERHPRGRRVPDDRAPR